MRSRLLRLTATTALALALTAGTVQAQSGTADFEKGVEAFDAGKYQEAIGYWEPLADEGNVEALRNLAQLYRLGLGVEQDDAKAFELYEQAAERGLAAAQVNAAFLLLTGKGVEQDRSKAATWFAKAADQGNALAQYNLGLMYEKGIGVKQNDGYALELYRAAAEQNQKRAIARLEALEAEGTDGEKTAEADTSETDATEKVADATESQGEDTKPEGDEVTRTGGLASVLKSEDKQVAEGEGTAKRPRPDKDEVAAGAEAAGKELAATDDDNLSIVPVDEAEEKDPDQPLEFEILEAEKTAPKATFLPASKPAKNGESDPEQADADAPTEVYSIRYDSTAEAGAEKASDGSDESDGSNGDGIEMVVLTDPQVNDDPAPARPAAPSDPIARVKLAEAAYKDKDFTRAAELLEPLSKNGLPVAQFLMGRLHNRGEGVELDRAEAYSLWRAAAAGGSHRAATALANLAARLTPEEIAMAEQRHMASGRPR